MSTNKLILVVDQSTSGTKALLVDHAGRILVRSTRDHAQYYPQSGWVEHDPIEIYANVKHTILQTLKMTQISPDQIAVLTITNQRETVVMWDKVTGQPIYNAIVWQCQRTADICRAYQVRGYEALVNQKTGLMIDPYFSASKWAWILDHVPEAKEKLAQGRLLAGTIDSWLLWKLTGGKVHATDYSNASRTSLFNIHTLQWDKDLCTLFGVPIDILPDVKSSDTLFGYTQDKELFADHVPISGIIGDSQAALFGQLCTEPGMAKATYGTGTSLMLNVGNRPVPARDGLVTTIAWGLRGEVTYAIEAIIRTTGDCLKWVRDSLGLFATFDEMDLLFDTVPDNEGVYLVPAFVGLGAPHWDPFARAAILGMSRATGKAHIVRAAMESIAYQVFDAVELMWRSSGVSIQELRVDGGATENGRLMQFQADILDRTVSKSDVVELSALGSVFLGGLGVGVWGSLADIAPRRSSYVIYEPKMNEGTRARKIKEWNIAVQRVLS